MEEGSGERGKSESKKHFTKKITFLDGHVGTHLQSLLLRRQRLRLEACLGKTLSRPPSYETGLVVHAWNPSYSGGRGRRILV
jgi:hypothetical protein